MAREAAGEHIHQRAVMVQMLLEICHVDPGILLYSWSCDYSKPLFLLRPKRKIIRPDRFFFSIRVHTLNRSYVVDLFDTPDNGNNTHAPAGLPNVAAMSP